MKHRLAAAVAAGTLVFLFVWQQVQATRLGFELDGARRAVQEAKARNAYLRLELERRTAPAELASLAREKLGMLPPHPESVVLLAQAAERPRPVAETQPARVAEAASRTGGKVLLAAGPRPNPRLGTQLLSWLLPSDLPRWR